VAGKTSGTKSEFSAEAEGRALHVWAFLG